MPSWHWSRNNSAPPRLRQRARHLGLAHARLALQQQRLLQRAGQVHRRGQRPIGQVALLGQGPGYVIRALERHDTAVVSARFVSTRARCALYSGVAFRSPGGSVPSAAFSDAAAIESASTVPPLSASSTAVARSGCRAHVRERHAHVVALDERHHADHGPVLGAAGELLVTPAEVQRRDVDRGQELLRLQRGGQVVLEELPGRDLALAVRARSR